MIWTTRNFTAAPRAGRLAGRRSSPRTWAVIVVDADEIQPAGRRGRARLAAVLPLENAADVGRVPFALADADQRSGDRADHVVKKPVGDDVDPDELARRWLRSVRPLASGVPGGPAVESADGGLEDSPHAAGRVGVLRFEGAESRASPRGPVPPRASPAHRAERGIRGRNAARTDARPARCRSRSDSASAWRRRSRETPSRTSSALRTRMSSGRNGCNPAQKPRQGMADSVRKLATWPERVHAGVGPAGRDQRRLASREFAEGRLDRRLHRQRHWVESASRRNACRHRPV